MWSRFTTTSGILYSEIQIQSAYIAVGIDNIHAKLYIGWGTDDWTVGGVHVYIVIYGCIPFSTKIR